MQGQEPAVATLLAPADPPGGPSEHPPAARRPVIIRVLPLAGVAALLGTLLHLGVQPISDPDTWWHLRAGGYLAQTWRFSGPEPWNRFASKPWVLHEWLPELVANRAYVLGGLPAVAWLFCAAGVVLLLAVYLTARRFSEPLAAVVATALGLAGMGASLSPRPQVVSFILSVVFVGAWLLSARDLRVRWWLLPLTWVWACAHGMWFNAVIIGGAALAGIMLDRRASRGQIVRMAAVPTGGLLLAALTPVGPRLLLAPLAVSGYTRYVTEWAPPSIRDPEVAVTLGMVAVVALIWLREARRPAWTHVMILLVATVWALAYARTVALGAAMAAPVFAAAVQSLLPGEPGRVGRGERRFLLLSAGLCLAAGALVVPSTARAPAKVPSGLDHALNALLAGAVVLNDYQLGGWLLWAHPQVTPVIDGRAEVFSVRHVDQYVAATAARGRWRDFVRASGAQDALLSDGSTLATALQERMGWRLVGADGGYVLLRAPAARKL